MAQFTMDEIMYLFSNNPNDLIHKNLTTEQLKDIYKQLSGCTAKKDWDKMRLVQTCRWYFIDRLNNTWNDGERYVISPV